MTLQQIEFFISCAALLNFSRAAKYHYTSISTISRQIAALEKELGAALFERDSHFVSLSRAGGFFFERAMDLKDILTGYRKDLDALGLPGAQEDAGLQIVCYPFDSTFSRLIDLIDFSLPGKPRKINIVRPGKVMESVLSGNAHLGVAMTSELREYEDSFDSRLFFRSPIHIRVGYEHPLKWQRHVHPAGFASYDPVLREQCLDNGKLQYLAEETAGRLLRHTPPSISTPYAPMDRPDAMLVLPECLSMPKFRKLRAISIESSAAVDFVVFWKKGRLTSEIRHFLNSLELVKSSEMLLGKRRR
ncbi:MAG: LysR family transcriptional regulator [Peptococcaceae bacterium]|jgi:DNA-binding transcriptional LysR family regulator|nr:LysR family transcriptional regulator [Peptococcaceae bacterium]